MMSASRTGTSPARRLVRFNRTLFDLPCKVTLAHEVDAAMPLTRRLLLGSLTWAGLATAVAGLFVFVLGASFASSWRESAFDRLIQLHVPASGRVAVVEIDDASLEHLGPWPWSRTNLARLLARIADTKPKAIGLDVVLSGPDRYGPEALTQQLGAEVAVTSLLARLPDGDARLASEILHTPTVLSALLGDQTGATPPMAPILVQSDPPRLSPWSSAGAVLPLDKLAAAATGTGIGSLAGDESGIVRQVPLMAVAGSAPVAGFAAETLRVAEAAGSFILFGAKPAFAIGAHEIPLPADGMMRFLPSPPARWSQRSVSALALLNGDIPTDRLAGKIVLMGGSAAATGALRATAASPVAPSVQIQADALETMLSGRVPVRLPKAALFEGAAFCLLAAIGALAGVKFTPPMAVAATGLAIAAWIGGTFAVFLAGNWLVDPVAPPIGGLAALTAAAVHMALGHRRQAAGIRRRFEQHLAPELVARIVEQPDLVRFSGERREVTALFTDIEGFTALTDRLEAEALVALLDDYFSGVAAIVVRHGGMIDKFVGDAAHCLFNAPLDLPDHPRRALAAASEIIAFTRVFARRADVAAAGLGRTRIGLESGSAVVGDVGMGSKLDYTAHGTAVNTAARLEAINKQFGTDICVGPRAQALLADVPLRALGQVHLRGLGDVEVYTPHS
jgi:adenylate cyclase